MIYNICSEKKEPFCCEHFPNLSRENFRQYIRKYRDIIEIVIPGRPCFYKLKGLKVENFRETVTDWDMGGTMLAMLQSLKDQNASIHDIKIKIDVDLQSSLKDLGYEKNPNNKGIILQFPKLEKNLILKGIVYPHCVQIDIGCSFRPFVYDLAGILNLAALLGQIRLYLRIISNHKSEITPISSWILTHFHFGKDGTLEWSGKSFNITFEEAFHGMVRFYSKKYPNGETRPRFEQIITPKISLEQELNRMASSLNF